MENLDFENLISSSVIDSGTAEILGKYYIKGKYVDNLFGIFSVIGTILFILFILYILHRND